MAGGGYIKSVGACWVFNVNITLIAIVLGIMAVIVRLMLRNHVGVSGNLWIAIVLGIMAVTVRLMLRNHVGVSAPNVSGTTNTLNFQGKDTDVQVEGATFNTGCGAGNSSHSTDGKNLPEGISGTYNSLNAQSGAKFHAKGAIFNTGAFSGTGVDVRQPKSDTVGMQPAVSEAGPTTGTKGELDSNPKKGSAGAEGELDCNPKNGFDERGKK